MNNSNENRAFLTTCKVTETTYVVLIQFPNEEYERNQIVVLAVHCILLFSTITLNGISIITLRKSSQLRSKVCYFVILLQSVVDLGVGVLGIPFLIFYLLIPFLDTSNCTSIMLTVRITRVVCLLSIVTLSAMTIERYIGVLHPYYYETNVTKKRILIYVCGGGLVIVSVLASTFHDRRVTSIFVRGWILAFFSLTGFVYTRIYLVIRKLIRSEKKRTRASDANRNAIKKQIIRESRRAKSCFLVVICFALFLLPITLSSVIFTKDSADYSVFHNWAITSMILNSSINSVIFFWTKTLLRKETFKTLKSLCS
jgi:hypothetical protein